MACVRAGWSSRLCFVLGLFRGVLIHFAAPGIFVERRAYGSAVPPIVCTLGLVLCLTLCRFRERDCTVLVQLLYRLTCDVLRLYMYHTAESGMRIGQSRPTQHVLE